MLVRLVCLLVLFACSPERRERFEAGEFKGFTKAVGEHIVNRVDGTIEVRNVTGLVIFEPDSSPLSEVLVELRGPDQSMQITSVHTDNCGRFRFVKIDPGRYSFKATLNGYQSVYGQLVVGENSPEAAAIILYLRPGV